MHAGSVGLIVLLPTATSTKRLGVTLDDLYNYAASVVIGQVTAVVVDDGHRYADIDVEEVINLEQLDS